MPPQSAHKVLVTLKEWEWLSACTARSLNLAKARKQKREAEVLTQLATKLERMPTALGDYYILETNRVQLKLLLEKVSTERSTLSNSVIPNYEARPNSEVHLKRTQEYVQFLLCIERKLKERL